MTKTEILDMIKSKINDSSDELEKALCAYIEIAKMKSFDENYLWGKREMADKIRNIAQARKNDIEYIAQRRKIVCITISKLYQNILEELGITAYTEIEDDSDGHTYVVIILEDGKKIKADIQADMHNIQTRCKLRKFQSQDSEETLDEEKITKLLIKLGYIKSSKDYKETTMARLKEETEGMDVNEAVEKIIKDRELYDGENIGISETYNFYRIALKQIVPQYIKKNVNIFSCYRKKGKEDRDYSLCIFSEKDSTGKIYLYSEKTKRFLPCEPEKMQEFINSGLVLGRTGKEEGIGKLRKFLKTKNEREEHRY